MENFSLASILALMLANRLLTTAVVATIAAAIIIGFNWEKVAYFVMRMWHGVPLMGTVSRLAAKKNGTVNDGWPSVELDLCGAYHHHYKKYDCDSSMYSKAKDYLAKANEAGRRPTPLWVWLLAGGLLVLEAVGFAFVIGPWVNPTVSANQMSYLAWSMAAFLALISGLLAHFAGSDLHYNDIIKKAHSWWRNDESSQRPNKLKQLGSIELGKSYDDAGASDYNQIMARVHTDDDVKQAKTRVYAFFAVILIFAVAAFMIRADTLKSIETDMVQSLTSESVASASISPFALPAESQAVNDQALNQSVQDKMDAIRRASLITYVVLSVIYVAIQMVMLWLSVIYGFVGVYSKDAWMLTHRFKSAEEMEQWLERQRSRITGHADHKLRMLQQKRSDTHTTVRKEEEANREYNLNNRTFLSYYLYRTQNAATHDRDRKSVVPKGQALAPTGNQRDDTLNAAAPVQVAVAPAPSLVQSTSPSVASAGIDAKTFHDLTGLDDDELETAGEALGHSVELLVGIRKKQLVLKKLGQFNGAAA